MKWAGLNMALLKPSALDWLRGNSAAPSTTSEQCTIDGVRIAYTLKRSRRRRSITLTIDESGLRVGAPWRAAASRIETVLETHASWIVRKLGEWQARRPPAFIWKDGAIAMLLGEPLSLVAQPDVEATMRHGDCLYVSACAENAAALKERVTAWLRKSAQDWFEQRAAHFACILGVRVAAIRLSNAKTRWGTCHPDGRILLNWRLIQAPPALIDYVVVHELAHLREPNHSPRFWAWVATVLPDYKQRRLALRRDAYRYLLA
jgi:predicted metal-dependent hydrolase